MRDNINKVTLVVLLIAVTLSQLSCKKSSFTDANVNPNSPVTVTPNVVLPIVETSLAYTQGGDFSRFAGLFDQQLFSGLSYGQQVAAYYNYTVTNQDVDDMWGNLYTSTMKNDQALMALADSAGNNVYSGISRILMAYSLELGVDFFGTIPYSNALKGLNDLTPTFDIDKGLYDTIASLINVGITQLNNPTTGPLVPGGDDIMYGGAASSWISFGHAIKARLYIHQSKGNATMATNALSEIALATAPTPFVNAVYIFGSTETTANPVYQFNEQRNTLDYPSATIASYMDSLTDPRYGVYFDSTYSDPFEIGLAPYYGSISGHTEFITNEELLFMQAEATLRTTGNIPAAQVFYQNAITTSMQKLGVAGSDAATYLLANGTLPSTVDSSIAKVAFQEYIALYLNPEAWALWRRTASPNLIPVTGSNGVPRRLLYPNTELQLNGANVPPNTTLFSPKIFWDN